MTRPVLLALFLLAIAVGVCSSVSATHIEATPIRARQTTRIEALPDATVWELVRKENTNEQ